MVAFSIVVWVFGELYVAYRCLLCRYVMQLYAAAAAAAGAAAAAAAAGGGGGGGGGGVVVVVVVVAVAVAVAVAAAVGNRTPYTQMSQPTPKVF